MPAKRNALRGLLIALTLAGAGILVACGGGSQPAPAVSGDPADPGATTSASQSPPATVSPAPAAGRSSAVEEGLRALAGGDAGGAVRLLSAAADATSGEEHGEALVALARAYDTGGEPDKATDALRRAVSEGEAGSASDIRARVALGMRLASGPTAGEAVDALRVFEGERSAGALQPYALSALASARAATGDSPGAQAGWRRLLEGWGGDAGFAAQAHAGLAAAAWAQGDTATYFAEDRLALGLANSPAGRLELGSRLRDSGDAIAAAEQYSIILGTDPASSSAVPAASALIGMGRPPSAGTLALVYYRAGKLESVVAAVAPVTDSLGGSDGAQAMYFLGAAYEDLGQGPAAVAAYDRAAVLDPGSVTAHRARYWGARVLAAAGSRADAAFRYAELAAGPAGPFTAEAAFQAGYLEYLGGDRQAAITTWAGFAGLGGSRNLYWAGKAEAELGDHAAAVADWTAAASAGGSWLYARLASAALRGESWPGSVGYQPRNLSDAASEFPVVAGPDVALRELVLAGLTDLASARLSQRCQEAGGASGEVLMEGYALGLTAAAIRCGLRAGIVPVGARWLYPLRYVVLLDALSRSAGIDPLFVAALVRQESLWQADVVSHAGAIGLAQLMPATARQVASTLGLELEGARRLQNPFLNLTLGLEYLRDQLRTFGSAALALAAYNAGPGNAVRWAAPGDDLAAFLEAIDFAETRGYVEAVLEQYGHYMEAYGGS